MTTISRLFPLALLAAALAACSTAPTRNATLDQSHERYTAARADPQVATLAADELKQAGEALASADQASVAGAKPADVEHLAYLAGQRISVATAAASSRTAQATVASAAAERDKLRLATRTAEADKARGQLAEAQQSNAMKTTELALADADAARSASRVGALEAQLKDLNAKKTDRGVVVSLGGVLFYTGQARLLPAATHSLDQLAEAFKADPLRKASIEGYTDSVGNADYNLGLSSRRADAVMTALVAHGVPADRLHTQAFGEESPVASNDTAAGRQMNRRVEVVFAPDAPAAVAQ